MPPAPVPVPVPRTPRFPRPALEFSTAARRSFLGVRPGPAGSVPSSADRDQGPLVGAGETTSGANGGRPLRPRSGPRVHRSGDGAGSLPKSSGGAGTTWDTDLTEG